MSQPEAAPVRLAAKTELLYQSLLRPFSNERLRAFAKTADDKERIILTRYLWNVALCEAYYPILHVLEIALRNAVFQAFSAEYPGTGAFDPVSGTLDSWLDGSGAKLLMRARHIEQVSNAKAELISKSAQPTEGRIVAELGFGFWTGMFTGYYGSTAPSDRMPWPRLLPHVFPNMPESERSRSKVMDELNTIRLLRNRVFHHESVWRRKAAKDERDILRVIRWISSEAAVTAEQTSRLREVSTKALTPHEAAVTRIAASCFPDRIPAGDAPSLTSPVR